MIVCSIETLDLMGGTTTGSWRGADPDGPRIPCLRDQSIAIIREIGVDTGGSNIQFMIDPANGDVIVENPRVRGGARFKATGFPIAGSPPAWRWLHPRRSSTTSSETLACPAT